MSSEIPDKWNEKIETTYLEYIRIQYSEVVQLIRELEDVLGKEKIHNIIGEIYERQFVELTKQSIENTPINSMADFIAYNESSFTRSHTLEILETSSTKLIPHTVECVFAKVFKDLDAADLGYIMLCATDFACTPAYNPKLGLGRTKTLMQGDVCCDFIYTWEEE